MIKKSIFTLAFAALALSHTAQADDSELAKRGEAIFQAPVGCWMCHGKNAEGVHAPDLTWGPEPVDISTALNSVLQMAPIANQLNLNDEDIVALSVYLNKFNKEEY